MTSVESGIHIERPGSVRSILWIHGYTGSVSAFAPLLTRLSASLDADVAAPLLPGHGTDERELIGLTYQNFLDAARETGTTIARTGKPITIIGYSFGGYLAAELAVELGAQALVIALTPYALRFPCTIPHIETLFRAKTFWDKCLSAEDLRDREGTFYYPDVPGTSLTLIKQGNGRMQKLLPSITCPILTIHNTGDPVAASESGNNILAQSAHNPKSSAQILERGRHALFFRPDHEVEEEILTAFLRECA